VGGTGVRFRPWTFPRRFDCHMRAQRLELIAQRVMRVTLHRLPEPVRQAARGCRVEVAWWAEAVIHEPEWAREEPLLGLFEGASLADAATASAEALPRIRLFVDSLWDYAAGDGTVFRQEVRVTLLHELAHYLGYDEEQVTDLGLE
jgi:predicted Zn-dependent protease with MMP-like domain